MLWLWGGWSGQNAAAPRCSSHTRLLPPSAEKPGSEAPHYHLQQTERVRVKQGQLGYFIGHQTHVQAAEAGEEVVIKPGVLVKTNGGGLAWLGMQPSE